MQTYLVRLNEAQHHPREIVGIFAASSDEHLADMIDECCDVDSIEIADLGAGGLYWSGPVEVTLPLTYDSETGDGLRLPPDPSISEDWHQIFYDADTFWRALEPV
ncbi:hypothetical protein [Sphingomonas oligophenolica]|uniref:Uncharacterized protein n=1 Tax=Sphingomonas oligophenolica TaxID=301154 RepID=A0A502C3H0_9SPHN|nr:hypothetical protein [Sphingomonas oligophenolica]TPG06569.1 hypothetical protein EAH84_14690 [Sphingomonas oligophenolica]